MTHIWIILNKCYYSDLIVIAELLQIKWMGLLGLKNIVGSVW